MGNKAGKLDVTTSENVNKDDQVISNGENKIDSSGIEQNGENHNNDSVTETKKKSSIPWFKKVSLRKEKKPKVDENGCKDEIHKENGFKEELVPETIKENGTNGDIQSENVETIEIEAQNVEEVEQKDEITNPVENDNVESEIVEAVVEDQ